MLELKIANFEESKEKDALYTNWKFVLAKENDCINLYAGVMPIEDLHYRHASVVSQNNLSRGNLVGGGDISYMMGDFKFDGMSTDFGIVPNSIMEEFARKFAEKYKQKYSIEKIEVNMWYDPGSSERANPEHVKMWNKLGYEFDNKERVLNP